MNNKDRYTKFKADEIAIWKNRFIFRSSTNDMAFNSISLVKYLSEQKPFASCTTIRNVNDFWKLVQKSANDYREWCYNINPDLSDKTLGELKYFFIGCIGEYFFCKLFEIKNTLYIKQNKKIYTFSYVCPRLIDEKDYGVDLTGTVATNENKCWDCAFQVKFWNPYCKDFEMTYGILSKTSTDAIWNDFIDKNDKENIFVCWLNNTDTCVSKALRKSPIWDNLVFIDKKVLNDNINNKVPQIWDIFFESINQF